MRISYGLPLYIHTYIHKQWQTEERERGAKRWAAVAVAMRACASERERPTCCTWHCTYVLTHHHRPHGVTVC